MKSPKIRVRWKSSVCANSQILSSSIARCNRKLHQINLNTTTLLASGSQLPKKTTLNCFQNQLPASPYQSVHPFLTKAPPCRRRCITPPARRRSSRAVTCRRSTRTIPNYGTRSRLAWASKRQWASPMQPCPSICTIRTLLTRWNKELFIMCQWTREVIHPKKATTMDLASMKVSLALYPRCRSRHWYRRLSSRRSR